MPDISAIHTLSELLRGSGARAVLAPERIAPSTIYDLQFRIVINALVFQRSAKPYFDSAVRIQAARQKLIQFVAIRPWLVRVVRDWSATQHVPQLSVHVSQRLRRGFLGDAMQEGVVEFLSAAGVFRRDAGFLAAGPKGGFLKSWSDAVVSQELFVSERAAIEELSGIKITNTMLEGW